MDQVYLEMLHRRDVTGALASWIERQRAEESGAGGGGDSGGDGAAGDTRAARAARYKSARDNAATAGETTAALAPVGGFFSVDGVVTKVRPVAKHAVFVDLALCGGEAVEATGHEVSELQVLLKSRSKAGGEMEPEQVKWLSKDVHLGDVVRASGSRVELKCGEVAIAEAAFSCLRPDACVLYASSVELLELKTGGNTGVEVSVAASAVGAVEQPRGELRLELSSRQWVGAEQQRPHGTDSATADPSREALRRMCSERHRYSYCTEPATKKPSPNPNPASWHCPPSCLVTADWLVRVFGVERLQQGSGVLDVAGGRGELAALLSLHGIHSLVIDPRENAGRLCKKMRSQLRKVPHVAHSTAHTFFRPALLQSSEDLSHDGPPSESLRALRELIFDASALVAMHPDECTEAAVDFALSRGIPFAVVPCCVFYRLFPHRQTANGDAVREYSQLLNYLQAKDPRIKRATLPFKGGHAERRRAANCKQDGASDTGTSVNSDIDSIPHDQRNVALYYCPGPGG